MASEHPTESLVSRLFSPGRSNRPSPRHTFEDHVKSCVRGTVFLHDNVHIVSSYEDGTMRKWDCETGYPVGEPWTGKGGSIYALVLSPDGMTIACARWDGSVQRWNTNGEMMEEIWTGHRSSVMSLSWSHNGNHIASGSHDGTILIRKADSGEIEVGPIETTHGVVFSLVYSPSDDRIASGGYGNAVCIWDSRTGELLVGPIRLLGHVRLVTSLAWSLDSSELYCASYGKFACVFDSATGTELRRFKHNALYFFALSPQSNILACVGRGGMAQLRDTESYYPLGQPFHLEDGDDLFHVSFSLDGRYLAYGGEDKRTTLWMIEDIIPQVAPAAPASYANFEGTSQQETLPPESPSSSHLDVNTINPSTHSVDNDITEEEIQDSRNGPYDNFFASSQSSLPSPLSGPSSSSRLWNISFIATSLLQPLANESTRLREHLTRHFFSSRDLSNSQLPTPINNPRALFDRLSVLHSSGPNTQGVTAPQQPQNRSCHHPPVVHISPAQDRVPLYVAWRPGRGNKKQTQQQQGQSQGQVQSSASQTPPDVVSTSASPPVGNVAGAAGTQPQHATTIRNYSWWKRVIFFACCASIPEGR